MHCVVAYGNSLDSLINYNEVNITQWKSPVYQRNFFCVNYYVAMFVIPKLQA